MAVRKNISYTAKYSILDMVPFYSTIEYMVLGVSSIFEVITFDFQLQNLAFVG